MNYERRRNERLQQTVFEAEARLLKISGLLRQAHLSDHEADRTVDQALLELQRQNRSLREALGLAVGNGVDSEQDATDLIFVTDHDENGPKC